MNVSRLSSSVASSSPFWRSCCASQTRVYTANSSANEASTSCSAWADFPRVLLQIKHEFVVWYDRLCQLVYATCSLKEARKWLLISGMRIVMTLCVVYPWRKKRLINIESPYRYELIDGIVYDMTGSSPEHSAISGNIDVVFRAQLGRGGPCRTHRD